MKSDTLTATVICVAIILAIGISYASGKHFGYAEGRAAERQVVADYKLGKFLWNERTGACEFKYEDASELRSAGYKSGEAHGRIDAFIDAFNFFGSRVPITKELQDAYIKRFKLGENERYLNVR